MNKQESIIVLNNVLSEGSTLFFACKYGNMIKATIKDGEGFYDVTNTICNALDLTYQENIGCDVCDTNKQTAEVLTNAISKLVNKKLNQQHYILRS
jgi:transcriptional antiterminator Rof (Rho-off)